MTQVSWRLQKIFSLTITKSTVVKNKPQLVEQEQDVSNIVRKD